MAAAKKSPVAKERTLLVECPADNYGAPPKEFKITIPSTAKVTMSAGLNPQGKWGGTPCLRVYEGTKQTACFVNVIQFRDLAYGYEEKVVEVSEEAERDSRGNRAEKVAVAQRWERDPF